LCLSLGYLGVSRFLIVRFGAFQSFLTARRFLLSEEPRTVALVSSRDLDLKEKAPPTASRRLCGNAKGLGVKGCVAAKERVRILQLRSWPARYALGVLRRGH
jgi:hypothetical protein